VRRAFTLIELLTVVAIIAVLAALLLPALARGKVLARSVECKNNVRDKGLAFRMHVDDNSDQYPVTRGSGITLQASTYGWLVLHDWKSALQPYLAAGSPGKLNEFVAMKKLRCPELVSAGDVGRVNGQYAYNASGTAPFESRQSLGLSGYFDALSRPQRHLPTLESQVRAPSEMIAAGDIDSGSQKDGPFWTLAYFDPLAEERRFWPGRSHNGRANMLFADGHVESARQTNWIAPTEAARRRWNNDNEPHPETWQRP
jgi:prepilin-type processing-associated H-X9-DG protein/prepilin-type N-terminal cleavage/methylation domain-containing protein